MRTGAIADIINYYFSIPALAEEVERALCEFFHLDSADELSDRIPEFFDTNAAAHRLFHEWFVFDFKLANGTTVLRDWHDTNPRGLSPSDMEIYTDVLVNEYGFFVVLSSAPGRVVVESFATGKQYTVREYSAAPFLVPRETIIARVAHVEGRYEFVSGLLDSTGTEMSASLQKIFRREKRHTTPQDTYYLFHAPKADSPVAKKDPFLDRPIESFTEAKRRVRKAMEVCDILPFVSVNQVVQWMQNVADGDFILPATVLFGLASDDANDTETHELVAATVALNNALRAHEGKTNALSDNNALKVNGKPRFHQDLILLIIMAGERITLLVSSV